MQSEEAKDEGQWMWMFGGVVRSEEGWWCGMRDGGINLCWEGLGV